MTLAVRCGTLIDGTGAEPRRNVSLVVEGNTIVGLGEPPRDAQVLDASHLTVMPGLIDCHVHLTSWPASVQERLLTPYSLTVARALDHARQTLEAGFTTVRDASGTPRGVKLAVEQGFFPGPRLRLAIQAISPERRPRRLDHAQRRQHQGARCRAPERGRRRR
jgi:imidazolonepropionase-like amidohydrolase